MFKIKTFQLILLILFCQNSFSDSHVHIKKEAAVIIAEDKLVKMYGKKVLNQKPFIANLEKDTWKIKGTFHCPKNAVCKGGVARIHVSAIDGSILHIEHEK